LAVDTVVIVASVVATIITIFRNSAPTPSCSCELLWKAHSLKQLVEGHYQISVPERAIHVAIVSVFQALDAISAVLQHPASAPRKTITKEKGQTKRSMYATQNHYKRKLMT
jgi:hypothetical protein